MSNYLNTTHLNVLWFKRAFGAEELQMAPPFQRRPVWMPPQKSYLIDTILRGYPIPEIYMRDLIGPDAKQTHIVVDGQQRILTCLEFIEGGFPLDPEQSPDYADLEFDDLGDDEKKRIYEYQFVVRLLPEVPDPVIRDIFQRLNKNNFALNAQELRQATYWGAFIQSMNRLSNKEYWTDLGVFTPNDIRRMLDVEFISELAIGLLHGPQNKKQSLDTWYAVYEKEFEEASHLEMVFDKVLGEMTQLVPNVHRTRWRKKSDFYTFFLVLASHERLLPFSSDHRQLASERLNTFQQQVTEYIREIAPKALVGIEEADGEEEIVSLREVPSGPVEAKYSREVVQYAAAVQRAASDLANRRIRASQLESLLAGLWSNGKVEVAVSTKAGDAGKRKRRPTASEVK